MNRFLAACGVTAPWGLIVETNGAPVPERAAFDSPSLIVGQDQAADLCLPHKDVSERHAFLQWIAGRLRVTDLGSRTGVSYDGRRQRVGWLDPGQSVRIGPYRLALAERQGDPRCDDPQIIPVLGLEMKLRGIRAVSARAEGRLVLLGSATDCEVRLLDPAVTSYHCAIVNAPEGSWVIDLLGAGGITVNGETTRSAPLSEGDVIVVGRSSVCIGSIEWPAHAEYTAPPIQAEPAVEPETMGEPARRESTIEPPIHAEPATAVVHHPAHDPVPAPASYVEPALPPPLMDAPAETATEPRRVGLFTAWRRGPVAVPNRGAAAPSAPPPSVDEFPPPTPARRVEPVPAAPAREAPAHPTSRWEECAPVRTGTASGWAQPSSASFEPSFASGPEGAERRGSCRYTISGRIAHISWWDPTGPQRDGRLGATASGGAMACLNETAESHNRTFTVSMVDVSQAGLAVLSPVAPPREERVWFRLDDEPTLDWVELIAVGHSSAGNGRHLVRFAFRETCPYDLFKALVLSGGSPRS